MNKKLRLELTWIGKEQRPRLEPRILLEDPALSHHAKHRVSDNDVFDNRLIFGDNLLALKALEGEFAGKVKCVFIDPPYNTGEMFEHYPDGLEHSIWLNQMRGRLEILRSMLTHDGVIWVMIGDVEIHYLKVLMDEVFGRENFINQISVKMKLGAGASGGGEDKKLKKNIEYLLAYARDYESGFTQFNPVYDEESLFDLIDEMEANEQSWKYTSILLERGEKVESRQILDGSGNVIEVTRYRGLRRTTVAELVRSGTEREEVYREHFETVFSDTNAQTSIRTRIMDEFQTLGRDELLVATYVPRSGRDKGRKAEHFYISPSIRRVIWLKDTAKRKGERLIKLERAGTLWQGLSLNNLTKEGGVRFPNGKKPEALIQKVLSLSTNPGDFVLDSFAGSGTTGAVAHKMGRRWIMVELREHAHTHIIPRMTKVVDGDDPGGVTRAVGWTGGGGFRYFRLAPSLLKEDPWGRLVINTAFNAEMLAEAVCKLEGFTYAPSDSLYWQHGFSTERDFIHVTTASLNHAQLQYLSDEVGPERTLLVACGSFRARKGGYPNLTLKKIPHAVMDKCEWGRDDYSLAIRELPDAPAQQGQQPLALEVT